MCKKAFTLIELIFTIVIIGFLSAVAVPKFAGLQERAKVTSEMATAESIRSAIAAVHNKWLISGRCEMKWGPYDVNHDPTGQGYKTINDKGYPDYIWGGYIKNASDKKNEIKKDMSFWPIIEGVRVRSDGGSQCATVLNENAWGCYPGQNKQQASEFYGPASNPEYGVACDKVKKGEPCKGKKWVYTATDGKFTIK